jgi:hypothetical protein
MLEHTPPRQRAQAGTLSAQTCAPNLPVSSAAEGRIADYLDHVFAPLAKIIPFEKRRELRAEMREHLEALIAAYQELGDTSEGAVENALAQFGSAQSVSRRWREEWERTDPAASTQAATRLAVRWFGAATLLTAIFLLLSGAYINYSFGLSLFLLLGVGLPTAAGAAVGFTAPSRPAQGTFRALSLLFLPFMMVYQIWAHCQTFDRPVYAGAFFAIFQFVGWTITGCATAGICGWLQRLSAPKRWKTR